MEISLTEPHSSLVISNRCLGREWETVSAMIHIYCRDQHGGSPCADCRDLMCYVSLRLVNCRFGKSKPTCANCPIHCYQRDRREQIKAVMRFAGPRMIWKHPWLRLRHLIDGWFQNHAATAFENARLRREVNCSCSTQRPRQGRS